MFIMFIRNNFTYTYKIILVISVVFIFWKFCFIMIEFELVKQHWVENKQKVGEIKYQSLGSNTSHYNLNETVREEKNFKTVLYWNTWFGRAWEK